jgi:hypothetical protein
MHVQLLLPLEHVYEDVFDVPGGWAQIRDMKVCVLSAVAGMTLRQLPESVVAMMRLLSNQPV